ncbi:MAG: hypothetical protein CVU62_02100 [Deltaproteobacteria bacterium HGW-Deltaproteobacteria-2]|jgi:hypothetical protein|nr:MAG: hypothetical protein CVU62_02100 [Deltaproteobacteria bacterium HGW-Deltaproteobacteria-2]
MKDKKSYDVILFKAVSYALKAEKILKKEGLPHKLIPVPKHISSDCGVCLMIHLDVKNNIMTSLAGKVDIESVRTLAD